MYDFQRLDPRGPSASSICCPNDSSLLRSKATNSSKASRCAAGIGGPTPEANVPPADTDGRYSGPTWTRNAQERRGVGGASYMLFAHAERGFATYTYTHL
jgi:hypothetical protein